MDSRAARRAELAEPVRELAEAGFCETQIVRKLGVGNLVVKRIASEHQIEIPDGRGRTDQRASWRNQFVEEILDAYSEGLTQEAVCQRVGVTGGVVRRVLNEHGVVRRPSSGRPPREIDGGEVVRRHLDGETVSSIADLFGVHNERIVGILHVAGVEIRAMAWGKNHQRWKGGRTVEKRSGYVRITLDRDDPLRGRMTDKNGTVLEHRYVMARALGRPLRRTETVHHVDGNRANNELDNLQLRFGDHGEGIRVVCLNCGSHNIAPEVL